MTHENTICKRIEGLDGATARPLHFTVPAYTPGMRRYTAGPLEAQAATPSGGESPAAEGSSFHPGASSPGADPGAFRR